jgi:glutamyl-Q tRNA(Asp) synthetase
MIVTRFAPSPTGHLHLGHAYSALFAYDACVTSPEGTGFQRRELSPGEVIHAGGKFLLRIEDIDPVRSKPQFIDDLKEDLHWLGLDWPEPVRRQSEHLGDYRAALEKLRALGVVYPCFCTRRDVAMEALASAHAPHGAEGPVYPGTCRALSEDQRAERLSKETPNWRLDSAKAQAINGALTWHDRARGKVNAQLPDFGDVVIARKDVPTSYHLSVTVDDHVQGVTLVTRGEDLAPATAIHRHLQALLGFDVPEYEHHRLLTDAAGKRFAKRDKAKTLRAMREEGRTPGEIRRLCFT